LKKRNKFVEQPIDQWEDKAGFLGLEIDVGSIAPGTHEVVASLDLGHSDSILF
jgi:hypothetical protein